jgi:hypothetical protein
MGGVRSTLVREAMETIVRRFGKEAAKEGTEALTKRLERLATQHGPNVIEAARGTGPRALRLIEDAGEHGGIAARLLAHHGDKAVALAGSRRSLTLIARYGDAAAEAMLKHPGIAEPLIEALGQPAINALSAIAARGGRRLAQMAEDGSLIRIGRTREVLAVVERFGDRAMDFVWRHKGALTVASLLAAFLADPEPFIQGVRDITRTVAENTVAPLAAVPAETAREAASRINWTFVVTLVAGSYLALRCFRNRLPNRKQLQKVAGEPSRNLNSPKPLHDAASTA